MLPCMAAPYLRYSHTYDERYLWCSYTLVQPYLFCSHTYDANISMVQPCLWCSHTYGVAIPMVQPYLWCSHIYGIILSQYTVSDAAAPRRMVIYILWHREVSVHLPVGPKNMDDTNTPTRMAIPIGKLGPTCHLP